MSGKILLIACIFGILASIGLSAPVWHDEALTLLEFAGTDTWPAGITSAAALKASFFHTSPGLAELLSNVSRLGFQITPPLYYIAIWVWGCVAGDSLTAFRLLSLGAWMGVAAVFHRWYPSGFALTLLLLSPLAIDFATLARNYALAVLWIMLTAFFLDAESTQTTKNRALGGITAALAVWTHYLAVFPIAAIILASLFRVHKPEKRRGALIAMITILLAAAAIIFAVTYLRPTLYPFPGALQTIYETFRLLARLPLSVWLRTGRWVDLISSALFVIAISAAAARFRTRPYKVRLCLFVVCGQALSLIVLSVASRHDLAQTRYLGLALPFCYPLFADLFNSLPRDRIYWKYFPISLAIICSGAEALSLVQLERRQHEIPRRNAAPATLFISNLASGAGISAVILHDIPGVSDFVAYPGNDDFNIFSNILPRYKEAWLCPAGEPPRPHEAKFLNRSSTAPVPLFREYSCYRIERPVH